MVREKIYFGIEKVFRKIGLIQVIDMVKKKKQKCSECLGTGSILVQTGEESQDFVENQCDYCSGTGELD